MIETPRLLLRGWQQADLAPFIAMNGDAQVMRYFPSPYSEKQTRDFYTRIQQEFSECGYGLYAAEEKSSGLFIGFIGLHRADMDVDFCPCTEIGWRLDKAFWGMGYATEGAIACLRHGFENLGLQTVYSFTATSNIPSQRVMQKAGMQLHCNFQHPNVAHSHPLRPHVCYVASK